MKEQYKDKIKSWQICEYLRTYNDFGFSNVGKSDPKTGSIYTKPTVYKAECTCKETRCPYNRKCIVAKTRY